MIPPLTADLLIQAYAQGYFPMADTADGPAHWYHPDPRAVLPLDGMKISKSLAKQIRRKPYRITDNRVFEQVIRACAHREETWINEEIIHAYTDLHKRGCAHSIEAWQGDQLVGGLYGVSIGGAFCGESMFSRATDASKICLAYLVDHLRTQGYRLLDTQFSNPHMARLGVIEIPQAQYLQQLAEAIKLDVCWGDS